MGAGASEDDGGYTAKVLAEKAFLQRVASGQTVPVTVAATPATPSHVPAAAPASSAAADEGPAAAREGSPAPIATAPDHRPQVALAH